MFGKNTIMKQRLDDGEALRIKSVFPTVQGEGPFTGRSCVFVRLGGCNLACEFCDTEFEQGVLHQQLDDLLQEIVIAQDKVPGSNLVVITGGEPLIQNVVPLIRALIYDLGMAVQVETAGTVWVPGLDLIQPYDENTHDGLCIVCSPKTGKLNAELEAHVDAYKYVISHKDTISPVDGLPLTSTQQRGRVLQSGLARPKNPHAPVYLSPMDEQNEQDNVKNLKLVAELAMQHNYIAAVQLHKILGVE